MKIWQYIGLSVVNTVLALSAGADVIPCYATVAQFVTGRCGQAPGAMAWVVDGSSASDCSAGGGSNQHYCTRNPDGTGSAGGSATIGAGTITSTEIANGTIQAVDLAPGAVGTITVTTTDPSPTPGTTPCATTGDLWFNSTTGRSFICTDGATDTWAFKSGILIDSTVVTDGTTDCIWPGEMRLSTSGVIDEVAICENASTNEWTLLSQFQSVTAKETMHGAEIASGASAYIAFLPYNATLTLVDCITTGAGTVVPITLQECDNTGANCTNSTSAAINCDDNNQQSASFSDSSVDTSDWMKITAGTITGTPTDFSYILRYRRRE